MLRIVLLLSVIVHFVAIGVATLVPPPTEQSRPQPHARVSAPVAAPPAAGVGPVRSEVYLYSSTLGEASWDAYNQQHSQWRRPGTFVADARYYLESVADRANEMRVDGVVIVTPHVRPPGADNRIRLEGRLDCLRSSNPHPAHAANITAGMRELGRRFAGRVILYIGAPDETDQSLLRDDAWLDAYVRVCIGPWLDSGEVDYVIGDMLGGDLGGRWMAGRVVQSIRRQWPAVKVGAEHHPLRSIGYIHRFDCSLTTDALLETTNVFRGDAGPIPYYDAGLMEGPVIIGYSRPRRPDLDRALQYVRDGRCVAIQPWTVGFGFHGAIPTDEDARAWHAFVDQVHAIRRGDVLPSAPPATATPTTRTPASNPDNFDTSTPTIRTPAGSNPDKSDTSTPTKTTPALPSTSSSTTHRPRRRRVGSPRHARPSSVAKLQTKPLGARRCHRAHPAKYCSASSL